MKIVVYSNIEINSYGQKPRSEYHLHVLHKQSLNDTNGKDGIIKRPTKRDIQHYNYDYITLKINEFKPLGIYMTD